MAQSNRERVGRALELLTRGLRAFIEREMQAVHRQRWVEVANQSFDAAYKPRGANWDASALLKIMWDQWDMVFRKILGRTERNLVAELRDTRTRSRPTTLTEPSTASSGSCRRSRLPRQRRQLVRRSSCCGLALSRMRG